MLLRRSAIIFVVILLLALLVSDAAAWSSVTSGPHLADVNILLPPKMTHPVEYRLQGTDGCFKWSWDHHDILAVLPEYNSSSRCSTSARLKSIAPYTGRKETAVYATDLNTGMVIRCKVYIDIFSRIQIFHNSIKLDLDGLATLRVRAFDKEENVFSSLVGLQFMWQLMPKTDKLPNHLVHVPLKDSPQSDCGGLCGDLEIQVKLEDSGVFSDLYVVKGIEIGQEIVSVHLIEPSFVHVEDKIILTVAEAMALYPPSPVYVLIGAVVNYSLKVIRGNIPQVVSLPSRFHQWSVLNTSVAQVDRTMGEVRALNLGVTAVMVEDTRVAGHTQMSSLHVVLPDTLLLYILPLSPSGSPIDGMRSIPSMARWYVVSGRQYLIYVKAFSQRPGAHEIYLTESDDVKLHDDQSEFWNILFVSDSVTVKGNIRILEAISYGLGKLMAVLTYSSGNEDRKEVIKVLQEVMVCDQVKFSMSNGSSDPHKILLPWAPGINQELEIKVTGGCAMASNDYKWFSSDMGVVSISASGIVQSKNPGKATIKAVSIYDSFNYDEMVIEVSIPSSMVMLRNFPVEVLVGSHLQASVTLTAPDGAYFAICDAFSSSIKWKTESESFTIVNATGESLIFGKQEILELQTSAGLPCASANIYAFGSGRTTLHATLTKEYQQLDHSVSGFIALKASSCIAAYNSLMVHPASDGNQFGGYWFNLTKAEAHNQLENLDSLFLVPGTQFDLMLRGGPERWDQGVEFIETVEALDDKHSYLKDGGIVHQVYANYGSLYRIKCENLGTFKLVFRRGNLVGDNHPLPAVSEVQLLLMCYFPSSIVLIADEAVNSPEVIQSATKADRIQGRIRATPITVANGRTVRLSAVSIGDTGKPFGNSSSLQLNWELINCDGLAFWDDAYILAKTKSIWERYLVLQSSSGFCTVRATVIGFIDALSHHNSITPFDSSEVALTDAARLQIVSSLRVNPVFSLLFFSHDARLNLSIAGGSCFLETLVNDSHILEVIQPPLDLQCLQLMLAPKRLGTALVTVYDIGLAPPLAASSVIQVADIDWIKITSGEEISLMEGNLLSISFLAGTDEGHTFDTSQYVYMDIHIHFEDHIFELLDDWELQSPRDGYVRAPNFTIRGTHLGVTSLYLSARQHSGHEVLSQQIKVEVYAPPRIHPSEIFLVPGASYVLKVRGGPTFGTFVKYASMADETARFQKSLGRISAISPGNTTLVATFYGKGDILICQAYGKVRVGFPSTAILSVQSEQLSVGRKMPIFPVLSEGNLFSFYELCSNYKWSIQDKEILSFHVADFVQGVKDGFSFPTANKSRSPEDLEKEDLGFLQVLEGISPGKTDVSLTFFCNFISSGSFSESKLYSANITLWVVPDLPLALGSPITWILPPHYTSSDLLPLSSNPYSKGGALSLKGTITYSLLGECGGKTAELKDEVIFIDGGKIKTKEADSLACIQANDRSTGRTEIASCVRVAEVAQVRILAQEIFVLTLAVGAELDLPIKYYDVLGNPFHEAYSVAVFEAETNYPDVVTIEDSSDGEGKLHLTAKGPGKALVQVAFINNPQKSDYVLIFVGGHLYPLNPVLRLGSHLNFSVKGLTGQAFGYWFSANDSIVCIDKLSGKAKARNEGSTHVHYEGSDLKLHTVVTVVKGELLTVDAPTLMLTNASPFPIKGYFFPVKLSDAYGHKSETFGNGKILFDCVVDPQFVGFARPWSDPINGKLYCIFFPYFPEQLVRTAPSYADMRRGLSIFINASLPGEKSISGSASVFFVGGFSVLEMDENSLQLNLSPGSNRSFITIVGNTDVVINWHDQDRLSVSPVSGEDSRKVGHALYEIKIRKDESFKDKLIITLQATGQRKEVDVSYEAERIDSALRYFDTVKVVGTMVFLSLLTFGIMLYCILKQGRLESRFARVRGTHVATAAPTTPIRSSPLPRDEQSPRTPQPFIDYVRRTIAETPNFGQDFRRRVNPQNTL
ncbi:hypothetical protein ACH5RR_014467 [Cinchona calisaya]|uniref:BIG2 domain-containing protein n=1 Tax=Cinchona calisaya TaxID=153742 RepID=A0ABD3A6D2_9GENT